MSMGAPTSRQRLERIIYRQRDLLEECRDQLKELIQLLDNDVAADYRQYTQELIDRCSQEVR